MLKDQTQKKTRTLLFPELFGEYDARRLRLRGAGDVGLRAFVARLLAVTIAVAAALAGGTSCC